MAHLRISACSFHLIAAFCLFPGPAASTNALDSARNALAEAERAAVAAKNSVSRADVEFKNVVVAAQERQTKLNRAARLLDEKERSSAHAHATLLGAQRSLARATSQLAGLRDQLDAKQTSVIAIESSVKRLLVTTIVLYDFKWSVFIDYNSMTGSMFAWAEMPHGLKISTSAICAAFEGAVPQLDKDPALMLGAALGLQYETSSTFDDEVRAIYRRAGPNTRVYVSTRGLSELLSWEHSAAATSRGFAPGGSTIAGTIDELARACLNELTGARAFLDQSSAGQADGLERDVMDTLIARKGLDTSSLQIKPFVGRVKYTARVAGSSQLPKYLPGLEARIDNPGMTFSLPRRGFAILVKDRRVPSANELRASIGKMTAPYPQAIKATLRGENCRLLEHALDGEAGIVSVRIAPGLEQQFRDLDFARVPIDRLNPFCLDLRRTPVGAVFERLSANLRIGNQGEEILRRLSFDTHSGQVSIAIELRAKEQTSLAQAINVAGRTVDDLNDITVRSWKSSIEGVKNLRHQIDLATTEVGAAGAAVGRDTTELLAVQNAVNSARDAWNTASGLLSAANKSLGHRADELKIARESESLAESRVMNLKKLIGFLSHVLDSTRPLHVANDPFDGTAPK
jgi:hypothetical protein